jgi:hypothetical protein
VATLATPLIFLASPLSFLRKSKIYEKKQIFRGRGRPLALILTFFGKCFGKFFEKI